MLDSSARFEDILAQCLAAIEEQGESVESCLARYPTRSKGSSRCWVSPSGCALREHSPLLPSSAARRLPACTT